MSSDDDPAIPPTVREFLEDYAATTISASDRFSSERLLSAPCSKQAFHSISRRLEEKTCGGELSQQLKIIADIVMIAGGVNFSQLRDVKEVLTEQLKVAAQSARDLSDTLELIKMYRDWTGLSGNALESLLDTEWFPLGLAEFASQADSASEDLLPPFDEFSRATEGRQFNHLAAYVKTVDDRLAQFSEIGHLPLDFKLSHTEMAGLAWATLGKDDTSIFSQRGESKDVRAEAVRKTRQQKISQFSALR